MICAFRCVQISMKRIVLIEGPIHCAVLNVIRTPLLAK
jgi:hypothetical protein